MKILHVTSVPVNSFGGMERVIWALSKELAKKHEVTILQATLYNPETKEGVTYKEGIKLITCKNDWHLGGYGFSKKLKEKLKQIWREYDIIHIHGTGRFTSDFALDFLKNKKPLIFTSHGFYHSKKNFVIKKLHDKIKGPLLKNADFCTALTELELGSFLQRGVSREKIRVIPNGIELERFNITFSKQLKEKYSPMKKMLLYVGRTHESKGLRYILYAIKNLDVNFIIAGIQTPYKRELDKIILRLGIQNKVKFIKEPEDKLLAKIFAISDIFILFSEWEGFGIVAVEAMAAGKPVIASNRGSLPHIIQDQENGLIVKYPNVKELELKIKELLKDSKKRRKLGKNAREFSKNFGWNNIAKKYEELYKEAIKNVKAKFFQK